MFQKLHHSLDGLKPIGLVHPESLKDKRVIIRCDFNVPIRKGKIVSDIRIKKTLKTINCVKNSGAKVILMSHIGRNEEDTLVPVFNYLKEKYKIKFIEDIYSYECKRNISEMKSGEIVLIENLRKWKEETEKDSKFSKFLSDFGEIFVNEAFPVSHREHSSVTGIPQYLPSYIGFQMQKEIENLSKVFEPEHPFLVLIGGAKFNTKIKLIEFLEDQADSIFVGGALSNDIYKAQGFEVGKSTISKLEKKIIDRLLKSEKIFSPIDVKVVSNFKLVLTKKPDSIKKEDMIVDGGPKTFKVLKEKIKESKFIIWNGPFGLYEKGHDYLTKKVAKELAKSDAFVIAGGGDTLTEVTEFNREKDYGFVSMGGGAMLEFIAKGTLVGIDAIKDQK